MNFWLTTITNIPLSYQDSYHLEEIKEGNQNEQNDSKRKSTADTEKIMEGDQKNKNKRSKYKRLRRLL